jgi:membrane fusion protein (multidrug efflux system)
MKKLLSILALSTALFMGSCGDNNQKIAIPVQDIPVVKVIEYDVPIYSSYVGQIYGQKDIPIRARVEGFLESIDFKEGSRVKKGQLLYTIDPRSLEAASNAQKSKVAEAETQLSKARSDLDRIKPLAESNAVSKSDLDAAQAAYDAAIANLKAAKSNLNSSNIDLSYTKVLSPIDGIIGKTNARVGEFVGKDPNPVILNTVSKTDTVIVKFSITEAQYLTIAKQRIHNDIQGQKDSLELELADGSTYDYKGVLDFVDRNINEQTGSIMVQSSFPNPNGLLRPGLYSKVKAMTDIKKGAIVVPSRCLKELQGQYSVYVVNDSNIVETRQVEVANNIVDLAVVTDGLKPNERVVIDAIQKVSNGMKINPVDSDFKTKLKYKKQ